MLDVGTVLVVDSDEKTREMVFANAVKLGEIPIACSSCEEAKSLLTQHHFKVVFCSDALPDGEYVEVVRAAEPVPVIVLSRFAEWSLYIPAMQAGAFDYIACPPNQAELDRILSLALHAETQPLK
jgi:two-component system, NtrC family, response regulator HydG